MLLGSVRAARQDKRSRYAASTKLRSGTQGTRPAEGGEEGRKAGGQGCRARTFKARDRDRKRNSGMTAKGPRMRALPQSGLSPPDCRPASGGRLVADKNVHFTRRG